MTRELPIGVFDSGVGGLTVVRQLHKADGVTAPRPAESKPAL